MRLIFTMVIHDNELVNVLSLNLGFQHVLTIVKGRDISEYN